MTRDHLSLDDREEEGVAADWAGIVPKYRDTSKVWRETSRETRDALLRAMGLDASDPQSATGPDIRVLGPGEDLLIVEPSCLLLEDGTTVRVDSKVPCDLPLGYHRLQTLDGGRETWIIKSPGRCWLKPDMRTWGWAVQLYAARSRRSWGIGDLGDLRRLARWSAQLGTDVMLLNPLSAVAPVERQEPSPYFPSSRRFRNPLYLDIEAIPGAADASIDLHRLARDARRLNERREIDRGAVFRLKMEALERLWTSRGEDARFDRYCQQMGESLQAFARYCALAERFGSSWQQWPAEYHRPDSPSVRRFAEANAPRVQFHAWLQWLLDLQLASAAIELPLVQDLPIGVDPGGADAWQWQDVLGQGVTVGAPPDQFNAAGQDWSLPPFIPHRLRATFYGPFIETLRASFRHAGGLRIDHVMGLFRLYWIPQGFGPTRGAYVRYPAEELLAIVALESHRAGAWVAGEDLGTVERQVRRRLTAAGMLSYKLLWFEDRLPAEYPDLAMAAISTHDLPTVAGLWSGADFAAQQRIGVNPSEANYREIRQRLVAASGLTEDARTSEAVQKAYEALGTAPSAVLVANLDDALAVEERPNMPGTTTQWPNWSLALPVPIEDLGSAALPTAIARALRRGRIS